MADGMREKTTNVGGVIKRIWYAMTGATQGAQLLSLDDAGNLEGKLLNPTINGTATGSAVSTTGGANKIVKTDSVGNINLSFGGITIFKADMVNKVVELNGDTRASGTDISGIIFKNMYSSSTTKAGVFAVTDKTVHTGRLEIRTSSDGNEATTKVIISGNGDISGVGIDTAKTADKLVKRNGTGDIAGVPNLSLITAENDFIVGSGAGAVVKKTLAETKTILGIDQVSNVSADTSATANTIVKRDANGAVTNSQYKLSALNTAPASATATGTLGEIRIDANYIYVCTATNTWKRTALTTW